MTTNRRGQILMSSVGIIGGAGPMAGVNLFQKIIQTCQEQYGCREDFDFPSMMLLNIPFEDMLHNVEKAKVSQQLDDGFKTLINNKVQIAAIACNTLHEFIKTDYKPSINFIHLINETALALKESKIIRPLVLCSTTSAQCQLHKRYFDCVYPDNKWQQRVQFLIDKILAGKQVQTDAEELSEQLNDRFKVASSVSNEKIGLVLGCTEFSFFEDQFHLKKNGLDEKFQIFDPNLIMSQKICKLIFEKKEF